MAASRAFAKPRLIGDAQQLDEWIARGKAGVFTVTTDVSPDMARMLLQRNESNRSVVYTGATRSVSAYAGAMLRGEWVLNGEPLIVSRCGLLNDGQHRLHAIIQAMIPVPMQITFGVDRETRHTVDQGIARSPGHILSMAGEQNTHALAGTLQMLWALGSGQSLNARPSMDQLLGALADYADARETVKAVSGLTGRYRLSQGYIAGSHFLCVQHNPMAASQYLEALTTGLNIVNSNSPVARLRRAFEDHKAQLKGHKLDRTTQAALYIKGYNSVLRGRTGPIAWRATGPASEAFPKAGA